MATYTSALRAQMVDRHRESLYGPILTQLRQMDTAYRAQAYQEMLVQYGTLTTENATEAVCAMAERVAQLRQQPEYQRALHTLPWVDTPA